MSDAGDRVICVLYTEGSDLQAEQAAIDAYLGEEVESYAELGEVNWRYAWDGHGPWCPCLVCADTRQARGMCPLDPATPPRPHAAAAEAGSGED